MTDRIKRFWMGVLALGLVISVLAIVSYFRSTSTGLDLSIHLESQRGGNTTVSDLIHSTGHTKNRGIVVHFWAAWCPPCLGEIQDFLKFSQKNAENRLDFVIVSSDKNWGDLEKAVPKSMLPAGVESLLDPGSKMAESFGTFQFPETYLLDRDGKVLKKWVGPQKWETVDLNNFVGLLGK